MNMHRDFGFRNLLSHAGQYVPERYKVSIKRFLHLDTKYAWRNLPGTGTLEDLHPYIHRDDMSTSFLLMNHFSLLFPDKATATTVTFTIYDRNGQELKTGQQAVAHLGTTEFRIADWLDCRASTYGSISFRYAIPRAVREALAHKAYFESRIFTRFYNNVGCDAFVHHVEMFLICHDQVESFFYPVSGQYAWSPETLIDWTSCSRLEVLMCNRSPKDAEITVTLSSPTTIRHVTKHVNSKGSEVFSFPKESLGEPCTVRVTGMPTPFGRPILMWHFPGGMFSVMHS